MNSVKEEKTDDPEIKALTAQFLEKAQRCAAQKNLQIQQVKRCVLSTEESNTEDEPLDGESLRGRFGWLTLGNKHIPYVVRNKDVKYCAVKMLDENVFMAQLNILEKDIYEQCTFIQAVHMTYAETRVLNEVNFNHCDAGFGAHIYTTTDMLIKADDAREFFNYLSFCLKKLQRQDAPDPSAAKPNEVVRACGFIRINQQESVVPYTLHEGKKYLPLFYFEGEIDNLKSRAIELTGWELYYLKFCCRVQGIRRSLFAHHTCLAVSLEDVQCHFPPDTVFDEFWPDRQLTDRQGLIRAFPADRYKQWFTHPVEPPHPQPAQSLPIMAQQTQAAGLKQLVMRPGNMPASASSNANPVYSAMNVSQQMVRAAAAVAATNAMLQHQQRPPPPLHQRAPPTIQQQQRAAHLQQQQQQQRGPPPLRQRMPTVPSTYQPTLLTQTSNFYSSMPSTSTAQYQHPAAQTNAYQQYMPNHMNYAIPNHGISYQQQNYRAPMQPQPPNQHRG